MSNITILQGDITQAKVDAIVNAANTGMLGGGGVDGAIHKAAGPRLLDECKKVNSVNGIRCPFGEARITSAGDLACKYVIHTVGPIYNQTANPAAILISAYKNSLKLAQVYNCTSIAFPAISCGVYRYPLDEAASIALDVCSKEAFKALEIKFYLFNNDIIAVWRKALELRNS
ncbi:MAG: O-acetyl-ADP-ribose deacetylase [Pseudomonadota bacterium]